ncbi:hypothetical protein [Noviherbaspirillum sp.]|uniref:hypothetical protein n=1 Tax=Noviherbaspirillum sp. TaxID=1926288 RepID=UPI002FE17E9B
MNSSITLHALADNKPHSINTEKIIDIVETRFGGCGIWFSDRSLPPLFWETKEHVLQLIMPKAE